MESLSIKCLVPRCCKVQGKARSVCPNHYQSFNAAVKQGQATWQLLERLGMVAKAVKRQPSCGRSR